MNGSVSRYFKLALVDQDGNRVPFYMIANDGNIMEHTVFFEDGELPTQAIAERYDIIVDFSQFNGRRRRSPSSTCCLTTTGRSPATQIPLEDVLERGLRPRNGRTRTETSCPTAGWAGTRPSDRSCNSACGATPGPT